MKHYILLFISLAILSCGGAASFAGYYDSSIGATVHEFTTINGRQCIWVTNSTGGGLSCDWR